MTNILTKQFIHNSCKDLFVPIADATAAYILVLLEKYETMLKPMKKINEIKRWIKQDFPPMISDFIEEKMNDKRRNKSSSSVKQMKEVILSSLVMFLGESGQSMIDIDEMASILPWDVRDAIAEDPVLLKWSSLDQKNTLPVTFDVNGKLEPHDCSLDFTMGLLTFCKASGFDFKPQMFRVTLENYNHHYRYLEKYDTIYSVEIATNDDDPYDFNGLDFMIGFTKGAAWAGVDPHNYWKNLRQYEEDDESGEGKPIKF